MEIEQVQHPAKAPVLKKVCAYARVSTGKDTMLHSLAAQVDYYSTLIRHTPGWEYVGVYTDEAKTGTKDSRESFQQMIADALNGKIDLIIVKSISRFARNTVTLLDIVRELKTSGVDVFFEEQNIHTMSAGGELMLTMLASFAQEESSIWKCFFPHLCLRYCILEGRNSSTSKLSEQTRTISILQVSLRREAS